ncbi:prolactin-releasing peptide receptor-like [Anneissia japonica]|uniref:prolactin-releasing peptide receptor-like n=1 Tax=Anneissia japonica TaxID=1529436 RepID=UPI001425AA51|nr:prolactin-releasing peptide receptor-like [Anneissia japonica]XP_033122454.1 prolactin-releasing peptide receptor-like [Anneissia japonica]
METLNNTIIIDIVSCLKCTLISQPCTLSTYIIVIFFILLTIILLLGSIGNLLVVIIVILRPKLRTVINFFIFNLAISDIVSCLIGIPFNAWTNLFPQNWVIGKLMCSIVPMVMSCCVCASTFTFIAIAIDRFCLVVFPLNTSLQLSKRSCCFVIVLIWSVSIVMTLPFALTHQVADFMWLTFNKECNEFWDDHQQQKLYYLGLFLFQFAIPLLVVTITNTCISLKLSRNVTPGTMSTERKKRENSRRRHMNRMLSLVVLCFAFCWLPLSIFSLVLLFYNEDGGTCVSKVRDMCGLYQYNLSENDSYVLFYTAHDFDIENGCKNFDVNSFPSVKLEGSEYSDTITAMATLTLAASNSCFNPILYAWMNDNFMREFMRLFSRIPGLRALVKRRNKSGSSDYTSMNTRNKHQSQVSTGTCPVVETSFVATKRLSIDTNTHDVQVSTK